MNNLDRLKAIKQNVKSLRRAALRQYMQGEFSQVASNFFLRRLREAEQAGKVAARMVIDNVAVTQDDWEAGKQQNN